MIPEAVAIAGVLAAVRRTLAIAGVLLVGVLLAGVACWRSSSSSSSTPAELDTDARHRAHLLEDVDRWSAGDDRPCERAP